MSAGSYGQQTEYILDDIDGISGWTRIAGDSAWEGVAMGWTGGNREKWLLHTQGRKVVVQAGGCCGMYPRLFAEHFDHVYTFEPAPLNFYCLVQNCQLDKITKFNAALGETCKLTGIDNIQISNPGLSKVHESPDGKVPILTIDTLNLDNCDLIQLDVEGYEINVLKGALRTIEKFKPTISCERGDQTILDFLGSLGYLEVDKTFDDIIYSTK